MYVRPGSPHAIKVVKWPDRSIQMRARRGHTNLPHAQMLADFDTVDELARRLNDFTSGNDDYRSQTRIRSDIRYRRDCVAKPPLRRLANRDSDGSKRSSAGAAHDGSARG